MRGLKNNKGFSLVELIVVIAIMGVMAALVIPRLGASGSEAKVKAAAREVVTKARYVRDLAITNKTDYIIIFTKDFGSYTYQNKTSGYSETIKLPDDVIISKNLSITYTKDGTSNSGTVSLASGSSSKDVVFSSSLVRID